MNTAYKFKDNERVAFDLGAISGIGRVVGVATSPVAVIGSNYMIKVEESSIPLPNVTYPFTTIAAFESQIRKLDNESS